jgi:hypothetical protein
MIHVDLDDRNVEHRRGSDRFALELIAIAETPTPRAKVFPDSAGTIARPTKIRASRLFIRSSRFAGP